ncbi:hypothetical protein [Polyangium sp. 15x6]|uniref:hypothetical protein n=1 Tax=Polyangium sp. 15x6 TaxID=3042687 RepID=UPI00249C2C06|nr:hypothetical protein [Polyangium sp. 15x6]MDI3288010.1 hypothetical protein [Polyangium sp. 15x6]
MRIQLDHEEVPVGHGGERAAPEIDHAVHLPCEQDVPFPIDRDVVAPLILVAAEVLAPEVVTVGVELHDEDVSRPRARHCLRRPPPHRGYPPLDPDQRKRWTQRR